MAIVWEDKQRMPRVRNGKQSCFYHVLRVCDECGDRKYIAPGNARAMTAPIRCDGCRRKVAGPGHPNHRGGASTVNGYRVTTVYPDDPMYCMGMQTKRHAGKGLRVFEHRLVAARKIGRPLLKDEVVHHINGDRSDNRDENLEVTTQHVNAAYGVIEKRIHALERHIAACCGHTVN